jgi:hypothetical protein
MRKSTTTKSPKKDEAVKISGQFLNEVELKTKNLSLELIGWNKSLAALALNLDKFDKVIQKTITTTPQELSKEYIDTQTKLEKIKKETESLQKAFNTFQTDFEKKLVTPCNKGDFNSLGADELKQVQDNIQKTNTMIEVNHTDLNKIIEQSIEYNRKIVLLAEPINKICVPDEIEKTAEMSEKLAKRLTLLCEMTSIPEAQSSGDAVCDPNLEKSFLHLYTAHRKESELLAQIQKNIKFQPKQTAEAGSSNSN